MSVQINCDRCGKNTKRRWLNLELKVTRGLYAASYSEVSPAYLPFERKWHLCEVCYSDLKRWTEPGTKVVYEVEPDV